VGSEEVNSHEENEEQLLYRVPIFDPFVAELCGTNSSSPCSVTSTDEGVAAALAKAENKGVQSNVFYHSNNEMENLHGMLPSDAELAEFAADVESLLGRGLENECVGMEDLGLIDAKEEECSVGSGKVKVEEEESPEMEMEMEMVGRDLSFELSFDYETCEEVKEKVCDLELGKEKGNEEELGENDEVKKKKISLQLDYEGVIIAWASQKSPWTTPDKPNLDPDECWHHCMVCTFFMSLFSYKFPPTVSFAITHFCSCLNVVRITKISLIFVFITKLLLSRNLVGREFMILMVKWVDLGFIQ